MEAVASVIFNSTARLKTSNMLFKPAAAGVLAFLSLGLVTLSNGHILSEEGANLVLNTSVTENCVAALPLYCVLNHLFWWLSY